MILGDPGRVDAEEVMSGSEFQYPKSLMERIGDWVTERFDSPVDELPTPEAAPAGTFGGGAGSLIGWMIMFVAVGAVVAIIVLAIRHWVPRVLDDDEPLSEVEVQHRRSAGEWADDAEAHEAAGEWKLAIRARYRGLVRTLVDRRQVADLAGRTTRELLEDLCGTTPAAAGDFESACLLFELPWYAGAPTGADELRRMRSLAEAVLGADVVQPLDAGPQVQPGRIELPAGAER
ncbi:MAG: DUF4129 domain-containing protein [Microthrixaceae bacterium]